MTLRPTLGERIGDAAAVLTEGVLITGTPAQLATQSRKLLKIATRLRRLVDAAAAADV